MVNTIKNLNKYWYLVVIGLVVGLVGGFVINDALQPTDSFDIAKQLCEVRNKTVDSVSISQVIEGQTSIQKTIYWDDIVVSCTIEQ